MRSPTYYLIRSTVRVLFWTLFVAGIYYVATHVNWVDDHFCWGTIPQCFRMG